MVNRREAHPIDTGLIPVFAIVTVVHSFNAVDSLELRQL